MKRLLAGSAVLVAVALTVTGVVWARHRDAIIGTWHTEIPIKYGPDIGVDLTFQDDGHYAIAGTGVLGSLAARAFDGLADDPHCVNGRYAVGFDVLTLSCAKSDGVDAQVEVRIQRLDDDVLVLNDPHSKKRTVIKLDRR